MKITPWEDNSIQFPRLLAELRAVGLTAKQYELISMETDLYVHEIDEILERAEDAWRWIKQDTKNGVYKMFRGGKSSDFAKIAIKHKLPLRVVVSICHDLVKEGKIYVPKN